MMAAWPSRSRQILTTQIIAPRVMRYFLYAALLAGVGALIHSGPNFALPANLSVATKPLSTSGRLPGGALVVCGGGKTPDSVRNRFLELAGGPSARIVVIPTAHANADRPALDRALEDWNGYPLEWIRVLHTRSHDQANRADFVRPLTEATGVWIGGGKQEMLTSAYLGTEVERQLMALLARGGVIGGTSAGAAVMSRLMIVSGRTEAKLGQGFDFFPGVVLDQHFIKRNRLKRLLGVIQSHPDLLGLGIDESTALVVDIQAQRLHVIGNSYVIACVPETMKPTPGETDSTTATKPTLTEVHLECLKSGDEADIAALRASSNTAVVESIDFEAL
jgi:cyanophycinase